MVVLVKQAVEAMDRFPSGTRFMLFFDLLSQNKYVVFYDGLPQLHDCGISNTLSKSTRGIPWLSTAMKDAASSETRRGPAGRD